MKKAIHDDIIAEGKKAGLKGFEQASFLLVWLLWWLPEYSVTFGSSNFPGETDSRVAGAVFCGEWPLDANFQVQTSCIAEILPWSDRRHVQSELGHLSFGVEPWHLHPFLCAIHFHTLNIESVFSNDVLEPLIQALSIHTSNSDP